MAEHQSNHATHVVFDTLNLKGGLPMVVCTDCNWVGWQLQVPIETPEQVEAFLEAT